MVDDTKKLRWVLGWLARLLRWSWAGIFLVLGAVVLVGIAYLMGHPILDGVVGNVSGRLVGNDSAFALGLVYWFERFYPRWPIWYPLQGMGVSLKYSYPMGTTWLIMWLRRLLGLEIVQMYRILSWATFPLMAMGVYGLAWVKSKRQTVGLIAGVFLLLSQATWLFQVLHGIFAQSFSMVLVAPILLVFDTYLAQVKAGKEASLLARLLLVLAGGLMAGLFLLHVVTATVTAMLLVAWGGLYGWERKVGVRAQLTRALANVTRAGLVVMVGACLAGFWLMPFMRYTAVANRDGLNTRSVLQIQEESLKLPSLLGLGTLGEGAYRYDFFFFAWPVVVFLGLGFVVALVRRKSEWLKLALVGVGFAVFTMVPIYLPWLAELFSFLFTAVYFRGLIPALLLLPIAAAWGIWLGVEGVLVWPVKRWLTGRRGIGKAWLLRGVQVVAAIATLGVAVGGIQRLERQPPANEEFVSTYKYQFDAYGPSLSDEFEQILQTPGEVNGALFNWQVSTEGMEGKTTINEALAEYLEIDEATILDVSPFAAGGAVMQGVGLVDDTRFTNLYHYYASLIHGMWGYQAGVFFGQEPLYKSPQLLADLADWFGIRYVVVVPGFDPIEEKYRPLQWVPHEAFNDYAGAQKPNIGEGPWGIEVWEQPAAEGVVSARHTPAVLVISDARQGGYAHVFRSGNLGAYTFNDGWLVEGSSSIDDYSADELALFDGVILHGYSYGRTGGAWRKLQQYVEQGGALWVDTGWQYVAQDWGHKGRPNSAYDVPDLLPVESTRWQEVVGGWEGMMLPGSEVEVVDFDPLEWQGKPWSAATATRAGVKEGAEILMGKGEDVYMAKWQVGEGVVVWSGLNMLAHVTADYNPAEAAFVGEQMRPMFGLETEGQRVAVQVERPDPDEVKLTLTEASSEPVWLLYRESESPYWRAYHQRGDRREALQIWRGGPGFVLVRLDDVEAGDEVQLEVRLGWMDGWMAKGLSVFMGLVLLGYMVWGERWYVGLEKVKGQLSSRAHHHIHDHED